MTLAAMLTKTDKPRITVMQLALITGVSRAAIYQNKRWTAIAKQGERSREWDWDDVEAIVGPEKMAQLNDPIAARRWIKTTPMCFLLDCSEEYLRETRAPRHYLEGNGDDGVRPVRWDPDEVFAYFDSLPL